MATVKSQTIKAIHQKSVKIDNLPRPKEGEVTPAGTLKGIVTGRKAKKNNWGATNYILNGAFVYTSPDGNEVYESNAIMFPNHITETIENGVMFEISLEVVTSQKSPTGYTITAEAKVSQDIWAQLRK